MSKTQVEKIINELTSREQAGFIHISYQHLKNINNLYVSTAKNGKIINIFHNYTVNGCSTEMQKELDKVSGNNSAEGHIQEFIFLLALCYPMYRTLHQINLNGYQIKFVQSPSISTYLQTLHKLLQANNFELSEKIESQLENQHQVDLYNRIKKMYLEESSITYDYKVL